MTKTTKTYHQRNTEKRVSRIKQTKQFILENTSGSLMNNHKWYKILEWIELSDSKFQIKTLLSNDRIEIDNIFELEKNSILVDSSGDFIDFMEIEVVKLNCDSELLKLLDKQNIQYSISDNQITIAGYL